VKGRQTIRRKVNWPEKGSLSEALLLTLISLLVLAPLLVNVPKLLYALRLIALDPRFQ
jgi:hypothetical protein